MKKVSLIMTDYQFNQMVKAKKEELVKYLHENKMFVGGKHYPTFAQQRDAQLHTAPQVRKCQ